MWVKRHHMPVVLTCGPQRLLGDHRCPGWWWCRMISQAVMDWSSWPRISHSGGRWPLLVLPSRSRSDASRWPCVGLGALYNMHNISWWSVVRCDWNRVVLFGCILRCLFFWIVLNLCIFRTVLFVSIRQVIGCEDHVWNNLDCVGWVLNSSQL